MIGAIKIASSSIIMRRGEKSEVNKVLKESWLKAAKHFHAEMRDKRFTIEHARAAGYAPRKGDGKTGKEFWRSYQGRKQKKYGHQRPLEFTGKTRAAVRAYVSLSSTSKGGKAAYPGARVFNYKNPKSDPAMNLALEFRRITPAEAIELAKIIDADVNEFWSRRIEEDVLMLLGY